jgi:hypothetical protein
MNAPLAGLFAYFVSLGILKRRGLRVINNGRREDGNRSVCLITAEKAEETLLIYQRPHQK